LTAVNDETLELGIFLKIIQLVSNSQPKTLAVTVVRA
jgi:hypothetical protein